MALTKVTGGTISTTSNYEVGVITATKFVGPFEGDVSGITTGASKVITSDESSDTTCFPLFVNNATDAYQAPKLGSNLTFNSSTGDLGATKVTAEQFVGNISGTGATFTTLNISGTLNYTHVTDVYSVGVATFANNVQIGAGVSVVGVSTFTNGVGIADSIFHTGDTNTALKFGTDNIQLWTGGTKRLDIDANGVVDITRRLELTNSGDNHYVHQGRAWAWSSDGTSTGTIRGYVYGDSSGNIRIGAHSDWGEDVRIDSNGFVGIATATVNAPLQVYNATNNTIARLDSGDATCRLQLVDSAGTGFVVASGDNLILANTSSITERFRIRNDGNVSIASSLAVTGVTTSSDYDLSAIDKSISDTANDIFVYDTRKDSDGGAWRKRTQHTSWYNEGASATRGARKEFPAVAVIVAEGSAVTIYDGDDPEMPLWMQFTSGSGQDEIFNRPQYWTNKSVFALNGIICITNSVAAAESTLVLNYVSDSARLYPISGYPTYGGDYNLGISGRSNSSGAFKPISKYIYGDEAFDVAMTVLPNALIDDATGLPIPTIAVATGHGVSVIRDNGNVVHDTSIYGRPILKQIQFKGERLTGLVHQTGNTGDGVLFIEPLGQIPFPEGTDTRYPFFASSDSALSLDAVDTKGTHQIAVASESVIAGGNKGLAIIEENKDSPTNGMLAHISKDFNTGYLHGDKIKGAYLADTDDTNLTGSELLSNGTFDSNQTSGNVTGWTERESGGTFATSGGQATLTYSSGATSWQTTATVVVGKTYKISFDIVSCTTTSVQAYYDIGDGAVAISIAGTAGKHGATFVATSTSVTVFPRIFASGNMVLDNFSVREAVDDRTYNNEGLAIHGSITKTAVATGAELVGYGPFSTSNRLRGTYHGTSAYPSIHHYETGDFHVMFWMNHDGTDAHQSLVGRDNREFAVDVLDNSSYSRAFRIYALNSSNSLQLMDSNADPFLLNTWTHVCVNYTNGNTASVYVNGVHNKTGSLDYDIDDTTNGLNIGCRNTSGSYAHAATATKLSLVRIGGTAPSAEQIEKIYEDEKKLFEPNAKCTLYGSSDAVTAVAYDDSTDTVHVGTSSGRSDFVGLNRINNTTTAVTTAISASNGLIAEQ